MTKRAFAILAILAGVALAIVGYVKGWFGSILSSNGDSGDDEEGTTIRAVSSGAVSIGSQESTRYWVGEQGAIHDSETRGKRGGVRIIGWAGE